MDFISNFFSHFVQPDPKTALLVVLNLIIIESLLSVDNAAVLATLVMDLPNEQRKRALRIGIIFAYIFRGLALLFASLLMKLTWLKLLGGGYLLYLSADFFYERIVKHHNNLVNEEVEESKRKPKPGKLGLNLFWSTVLMVEVMDLTFSIDNVFAAVAFTKNIYLIWLGVFIGIITMRIVASYFVVLMERFPFLDIAAFVVIAILGLRLCCDFFCTITTNVPLCELMHSEKIDFYFSIVTVAIFFLPIVASLIMGKGRK